MRMITILAGGVLVITGIWCFAQPGTSILTFAFVLGISMLIAGSSHVATYGIHRSHRPHVIWQLPEGLISLLLAVLLLSGRLVSDETGLLFFSLWILFCGVNRTVASLIYREQKLSGWYYSLAAGFVSMLLGMLAGMDYLADGLILVILIGGTFLMEGINTIVAGVMIKPIRITHSIRRKNHEQPSAD